MRFGITALILLLFPLSALAQPADRTISEPTTVNFVTGFSVGSDEVGPLAGGSLSAGITPWLSLEGAAGFTDRGPGVNGIYALAAAVFNVMPAASRVVPFATIGGGLYHAGFDMGMQSGPWVDDNHMTGPFGLQMPGQRTTQMPMFYANRAGAMFFPDNGRRQRRSFTDPAASVGGGVAIRLSSKVVLRPDARALLIFNDGDTYAVGLMNVGIGFRF